MTERGHKAAAVVMVAALAYGVGQCSAKQDVNKADSLTPVKVTPGPTKIVTKTRTVTRETMPEPCRDALKLAKEIDSNAGPLIDVSNQALDILEQAHESLAAKDGSSLNRLRTQLYDLEGKASEPTVALKVNITPEFARQMKACLNTDAYRVR